MRSLEAEVTIRATPEEVWSVLTDFGKYPQWNPFIREASGDATTGSRLTVRIHPPDGSAMSFRPTVQQAAVGRELRWLGHLLIPGLFDGEHVFQIESLGDRDVRFRQSEHFSGILVPLFPSSMYEKTRRGFEAMNLALKERVEAMPRGVAQQQHAADGAARRS